ncbi:MAG TPA: carbohydrate ABC transporter permease [Chloroflexota bacterium]|nr:carbohydrate ABC transporter permease [Chloroflexota bacterium]
MLTKGGYAVLLAIVLLAFLAPFVWMILNSLKTPLQISQTPPDLVFTPTLANYANVFGSQDFLTYMRNSTIIAGGSTLFALVLGLPAAYSIARFRQRTLSTAILVARIVPGITFLIPWFILFRQLHLVDTFLALILTHMLVGLPFIVWVMIPFFEAIPRELDEAARVDGCSIPSAFARVILPLSVPGVLSASILAFIFSWNNFMFSIVLATNRTKTLPVAIYNFISYAQIDWGGLMAAAVVITVPVLVLALVTQRFIVRGLTAGAVKG